ncbi:hypothetical protein KKB99_08030, partial [bacterium]|nr:hypothetical protein [bacterium]MBU1025939.1 hypothetical protein [bacterium]
SLHFVPPRVTRRDYGRDDNILTHKVFQQPRPDGMFNSRICRRDDLPPGEAALPGKCNSFLITHIYFGQI